MPKGTFLLYQLTCFGFFVLVAVVGECVAVDGIFDACLCFVRHKALGVDLAVLGGVVVEGEAQTLLSIFASASGSGMQEKDMYFSSVVFFFVLESVRVTLFLSSENS